MLIKSSNIYKSSFLQQLITYYESVAGEGQIQRKMASYMSEVYGNIGNSVNLLVNGYVGNLLKFSNRFNNEIGEYDAEYIFNTEAMNSIITSLTTYKTNYKDSLDKLKPLVERANENGIEFDYVFDANLFEQDLDQVIACPKTIIEKLEVINSDTTFRDNVDQLSSSLINFIEYAKTNINIGEFDVEQLQLDPNYINLINASIGVADQLHINAEAIELESTSGNFANYQVFKEKQLESDKRFYKMGTLLLGMIITAASLATLGPFLVGAILATDAISLAYNFAEYQEYNELAENSARKGDSTSGAFNFVRDTICGGNENYYNGLKATNEGINTALNICGGIKGAARISTLGSAHNTSKVYGIAIKDLLKDTGKKIAKETASDILTDSVDYMMQEAGCSERARIAVTKGAIPIGGKTIGLGKQTYKVINPSETKGIITTQSNLYISTNMNNGKATINMGLFSPKNSTLRGEKPTISKGRSISINMLKINKEGISFPDKIIDCPKYEYKGLKIR